MIPALLADAAAVPVALGPEWLDATNLINSFGVYAVWGIVLVIFIETGLLFPLLPGDSLLFIAGAMVAQGTNPNLPPLWLLCGALFLAAFAGDQNAYWIGRKVGPKLFEREDSRVFKKSHIDKTHAFFDKHGGKAIILARFVPFVRTYSAVTAGVARMHYRTFVTYDLVGAFLWGVGVTMLGFWLGNIEFVKNNIEVLLVLIVAVSVLPIGVELLRHKLQARRAEHAQVQQALAEPPLAEVAREAAAEAPEA